MGAVFVLIRFSLARISIQDQDADEKSLVRNSGVGGWGSKSDPQIAFYSPLVLLKAQESLQMLEGSNLLPALQLYESRSLKLLTQRYARTWWFESREAIAKGKRIRIAGEAKVCDVNAEGLSTNFLSVFPNLKGF